MPVNKNTYLQIKAELDAGHVELVAVSKTNPVSAILELYGLGQRDFGENYVGDMVEKARELPGDIHWHFIGHLQTNKVKLIAPFVQLIHGVDSLKLLAEINKQGEKNKRVIDCLLQVHIAQEETKFGLDKTELDWVNNQLKNLKMLNIRVCGLMGMASLTNDRDKVRKEFRDLHSIFEKFKTQDPEFKILSMGMSSDYKIAMEEGSTMVRIGSLLFGERTPAA